MQATDDRAKELAVYLNRRIAVYRRTQYEPLTSKIFSQAFNQVLDDQLALTGVTQ